MPRKPIELPAGAARDFLEDMRAFFAEKDSIKRDEIAARQLHALKQHYTGKPRLFDVRGDVSPSEGSRLTRTNRIGRRTWKMIGTILAAAPAQAQIYDPNYPVCVQVSRIEGSYITCGYTSMAQ